MVGLKYRAYRRLTAVIDLVSCFHVGRNLFWQDGYLTLALYVAAHKELTLELSQYVNRPIGDREVTWLPLQNFSPR